MDSSEVIKIIESPSATTKVSSLLASGKIDANDPLGFRGTPLTVALRDANLPLARLLMEHGADPWAVNVEDPPLVVAARWCSAEAIHELLNQPQASTSNEQVAAVRDRALWAAAAWCRSAVMEALLSHGANANSMPYAPEGLDASAPPKKVLITPPPVNVRLTPEDQATWGTGTALHFVARATPPELRLWDKVRGRKPWWTEQDQIDCIKAMIRSGADRSLRDEKGRTALEVAEATNASKNVIQALRGEQ